MDKTRWHNNREKPKCEVIEKTRLALVLVLQAPDLKPHDRFFNILKLFFVSYTTP